MTVTSVKKQRGFWYNVEFDGAQTVKIDRRTWDESPYHEGSVLSEETLAVLLAASARRRVREKAIWYLSMRDYTKQELSKKLPDMSEDEQLALLATDGMLVKRPLLVGDSFVLTGFKEEEWKEKLL